MAILSPALYGITNFIEKFLVEKKIKDPVIVPIFGGITTFVIGTIILAFSGFPSLPRLELVLILLSGIFLELYLIPYFIALSEEDASRIIPLFQFIPFFILILSYFFLKENLDRQQLLGFLLIFCGGFALGVKQIKGGIFKLRKALYLMIAASFLYSLNSIIFKFVAISANFWTTIAYQFMGMGLGALLLLSIHSYRQKFSHDVHLATFQVWSLLSLNQIIVILAQLVLSYAYLLAPIALVSVVAGGAQPLLVLSYGLILTRFFPHIIKEDIKKIHNSIKTRGNLHNYSRSNTN